MKTGMQLMLTAALAVAVCVPAQAQVRGATAPTTSGQASPPPPPPAPPQAQSTKLQAMPADAAGQASYKQRMVAAIADVMPVGKIMTDVAAANPWWPSSQDRKPDPTKLSCMRANMKEDAYRKVLVGRVDNYARTNAHRFGSDLQLVEGEGGKLFAKIMMAGARSATSGESKSMDALLADSTPRALLELMQLANDPDNAPLRGLMGMDSAIGTGEGNGRQIGEAAGMTMMMPMLVDAMETCKVKMDEL